MSLLSRSVGVLVKSLAGLRLSSSSSTQATRCSSLPSALAAVQCITARWFSKNITLHDFPSALTPKEPPKRPVTAFLRFSVEHRPLQIKKHPEASVSEMARILGSEWRGLSEAEKQVYIEAARVDFLKYREHYQKYKESLNPLDLEILRNARKQKRQMKKATKRRRELVLLGKPKRCRNAFNIFMSEHYHEVKVDTVTGKLKNIVHEWQNLPSSKKQVYNQLAEDDKIRYENEIKAWEQQMIEIGREDLIRHRQKPRRSKKKLAEVDKEPAKKEKSKKAPEPAKGRKKNPGKHEE